MSVMLGNLSIKEIEKRMGIPFPDDVKEFMSKTRQADAQHVPKGKWHCFDIPFNMVCGDMETAAKIYNSVKARSGEVKQPLQFSIYSSN